MTDPSHSRTAPCGHVVAGTDRFCMTCGTPIAPTPFVAQRAGADELGLDGSTQPRRTFRAGGVATVSWADTGARSQHEPVVPVAAAGATMPPGTPPTVAGPVVAPPYGGIPAPGQDSPGEVTYQPAAYAKPATYASEWSGKVQMPAVLWLVIGLLVVSAGFLLVPAGILVVDDVKAMASPGAGAWRAFLMLPLALAIQIAGLGVGLLVIARMVWRGDQVGRVLGIVVAGSVVIAEMVAGVHGAAAVVTVVLSLAVVAILGLIPPSAGFFRSRDGRPTGVATAIALISSFAWMLGIDGVSLIPFHNEKKLLAFGIGLIVGSVLLLVLCRPLGLGNPAARAIASLVLLALAVIVLLVDVHNAGTAAFAGIAIGCVGLLWLPESSGVHFSPNRPASVRVPIPRAPMVVGLAVVAVVLLITFLLPNGSSTPYSYTPTYAATTQPSPAASYTTRYVTQGYAHAWSFTESRVGGYAATGAIRISDPQPFTAGLTNGTTTVGVACQVDPTTDAVVAAEVSLTNQTSSFPMSVGVSVGGLGSFGNGESLEWEGNYTSGNDCSGSGTFGLSSTTPLPSSQSVTVNGFLVLHNYYTPDHPNGDEASWQAAYLTISKQQTANGDSLTVDGFFGTSGRDTGYGWSFGPSGVG
jgi:hypothetical protein